MTLEKLQISKNDFANHVVVPNSMYREGNGTTHFNSMNRERDSTTQFYFLCTGRGTVQQILILCTERGAGIFGNIKKKKLA